MTLTAVSAAEVIVDRCPEGHGLFLDRGELGRLMRTQSDELLSVLELLASVDSDALTHRREAWKRARDERRRVVATQVPRAEAVATRESAASLVGTAPRRTGESRPPHTADEIRRFEDEQSQRASERTETARARWMAQREEYITLRTQLVVEANRLQKQIEEAEQAIAALREQWQSLQTEAASHARRIAEIDRELAALDNG